MSRSEEQVFNELTDDEIDRMIDAQLDNARIARPATGEIASSFEGRIVGGYRLRRLIARGGYGAVFIATAPPDAVVAVKITEGAPGIAERAHFERETQLLRMLSHPNLPRLIASGESDDGLLYIVMEFLTGDDFAAHCAKRLLSVRERVELFTSVLDALQHVHASGVVHRDVKPGNIVVDAGGVPKLLDFGVAKVVSGGEPAGEFTRGAFTPQYASPEQLEGAEPAFTSDIYSAGLVLYELVCGLHPATALQNGGAAVPGRVMPSRKLRLVIDDPAGSEQLSPEILAHERATTPAELHRQLAGTLDSIIMKAIRRRPEERYASAAEFADDLRAWLAGRPARAVREGRARRGRSVAIVAVLVVLIATASIWSTVEWRARERDRKLDAIETQLTGDSIGVAPLDTAKLQEFEREIRQGRATIRNAGRRSWDWLRRNVISAADSTRLRRSMPRRCG